ncbi:MAG: hypothetical protein R6V83_03730 [Candidatus Thorarchaeota archaeon]
MSQIQGYTSQDNGGLTQSFRNLAGLSDNKAVVRNTGIRTTAKDRNPRIYRRILYIDEGVSGKIPSPMEAIIAPSIPKLNAPCNTLLALKFELFAAVPNAS